MAQLRQQLSASEASAAAAEERAVATLAAQRQALRDASEAQQVQHAIALEEVGFKSARSQQLIDPALGPP